MNKKVYAIILIIFIGLGLAVGYVKGRPDGQLHLVVCDVGQGDSILIQSPSGHNMLIDGGPDSKVVDCLSQNMPFWQRHLDAMLMTHPQADHMTGFVDAIGSMKVDNFLATGLTNDTDIYRSLISKIASKGIKTTQMSKGQVIDFGDGAKVQILWPESSSIANWQANGIRDLNDSSISVKLSYQDFCAILTGDLPATMETKLETGNCPILKAGHHGSKTASSDTFLSMVGPKEVIISVGYRNRYGHPSPETLDKLKKLNVRIWRTDQNGSVKILTDGKSYRVESQKN